LVRAAKKLSGNQEDPITSIEKKGKEEIYLGLEIAAVTEYPTHDEDGGLVKKKEERDEGICPGGVIYICNKRPSSEHQGIAFDAPPNSVSSSHGHSPPSRFTSRPFLPFSSILQRPGLRWFIIISVGDA
jgi:hypothetical protein